MWPTQCNSLCEGSGSSIVFRFSSLSFWKGMCVHRKGKLTRLREPVCEALSLERTFRWRCLSGGKRFSALVCWSWGFVAPGTKHSACFYPQKQKALSLPLSPFFLRCHILKKNKTEKEQIYSLGAWRSMNYLFLEILYFSCMKESPIIKSECFFFCMSVTGRWERTDF